MSIIHCSKRAYDKRGAITAINHRMRGRKDQRRNRPEFLRPYYCDQCRAWHITHQR